MSDEDYGWSRVEAELLDAKAMHYDGCHKIYLSMDDEQVRIMLELGYDAYLPDLDLIKKWYEKSCGLESIYAVHTVNGNPNDGFNALIPQGWDVENGDWF